MAMKHFLFTLLWIHAVQTVPAQEVNYERDIRPLLVEKCSSCHGALKQEAGLRLDAGSLVRLGGDSGAARDAADRDGTVVCRAAAERRHP